MKRIYFIIATAALMIVGCNKEADKQDTVVNTKGTYHFEITATIDNTTSKATYSSKKVVFGEGDEIAVIGTKDGVNTVYTLTGVQTGGTVTFSTDLPEGTTVGDYAYYPASIATAGDGTVISWPKDVDGAKVEVPMIGLIDVENNKTQFKYLGAIMEVAVDNAPDAKYLIFNAGTAIEGQYDVTFSGETPSITARSVSGYYVNAKINGNGTYYIPVPAKTYTSFTFSLTDSEKSYYYKQRSAVDGTSIALTRGMHIDMGTITNDTDKIEEWWHGSPINGWQSGYDRYIKTGENTYQLTVFNPSDDPYWELLDKDGYKWRTDGEENWNGTVTKRDIKVGTTGWSFKRGGANDKTFWVTLQDKGEEGWYYNSGNWDNNSDRGWESGRVEIVLGGTKYTMEKYGYGANYGYKCLDVFISDDSSKSLKFNLSWNGTDETLSGVSESLDITDAKPYGSFVWAGENPINVSLTRGNYNVYLDLAILNFMFVKQ